LYYHDYPYSYRQMEYETGSVGQSSSMPYHPSTSPYASDPIDEPVPVGGSFLPPPMNGFGDSGPIIYPGSFGGYGGYPMPGSYYSPQMYGGFAGNTSMPGGYFAPQMHGGYPTQMMGSGGYGSYPSSFYGPMYGPGAQPYGPGGVPINRYVHFY
jgi:hypothetical protein